jgi:uncharacterized protein (DUF1800 family)
MPSRRAFLHTLTAAGLSGAVAGCEQTYDSLAALVGSDDGLDFRPPSSSEIDLVSHVINRLTCGPRPGDYRRVAALGADAFIDEQLHPERISDRRCDWIAAQVESMHQATPELYDIPPQQLLADMARHRLLRAIHSRRQLYEVMVEFWRDHFNMVSSKGDCKWLTLADEREVIRPHALGRFRHLIRASALSPAMLIYLDGHDNKVEHAGERPNENYVRELLELHTLGVHGGYTQGDVMEVARCLSGWTVNRSAFNFRSVPSRFVPARHDHGEKIVLGHVIPSGGGERDLDRVLDIVCDHPSTADFIATKLCRRFIADPAPPDAVGRVSRAFRNSSGDIRATLASLFATDAFRDESFGHRGNNFKRPAHFIVSALRAVDAKTDAAQPLLDALERMGHAPFQYPTPDGYPLEEQPWLGTLLWRWNFAIALQNGTMRGTGVDLATLNRDLGGTSQLAAHLLGRLPTDTEMAVINQSQSTLALLLSSPAFQRY